jgi:hypothetical protein
MMDPDLDSQVKSRMLELKSESFLSSLKKEEGSIGTGVSGEATAFAAYRLCWERHWGDSYSFEDQSTKTFTHMILVSLFLPLTASNFNCIINNSTLPLCPAAPKK